MERLLNFCFLLVLFYVRLFSSEENIKVNINPNRTIFNYELGEKPKENITCESDCLKSLNCTYVWYLMYNDTAYQERLREGNVLIYVITMQRNSTFRCEVYSEDRKKYGRSDVIKVIVKDKMLPQQSSVENRPNIPPTHSVSVIQSSTTTMYSQSTTAAKYVENNESILIIGISGGTVLLMIVVLVIILCVRKKQFKQNKTYKESRSNTSQGKDHGLEMTENTLYISTDIVTEKPQANSEQNNTPIRENRSDVYAVVNKIKKNENHIPVYAEIRKSQPRKEKTAMNKKPSVEDKKQSGQNENTAGMVYLEIVFDNMSSNRKSSIQGAENRTQYVDINSIKHADPLLKSVE